LIRRAQTFGLPEEEYSFLSELPELSFTVAQMKNGLHMALAFSPLLALLPGKISGDGIRRDHLLAVRFLFSRYSA